MRRELFVVAGLLTVGAGVPPPDVDAVMFARAFYAGQADQYKHRQVSGTGTSFHGPIAERIGDGSTRTSLVVTLGALPAGGELTLLKTWDEFVAAERAHTTLVVALSGPDLPKLPSQPTALRFSGVYDGQVRTIMRLPHAGASEARDSGPCPGEQAPGAAAAASFYCAPLLTGTTATASPQ